MSATLENAATIREQHLQTLAPFCRALDQALSAQELPPDQALDIWRTNVSGVCVCCGTIISGDDLFGLSQTLEGPYPSAPLQRLSLGYCPHPGCESFFCRLTFRKHEKVDWPALLERAEALMGEPGRPAGKLRAADYLKGFLSLGLTRRIGIGLALLIVLLLVRQWYGGGRIPWVREPERFRVDPAPETNEPAEHGAH